MVLVCAARSSDRDAARFNVERIRTSDDIYHQRTRTRTFSIGRSNRKDMSGATAVVTGVLHDCSSDSSL